MKKRHIFLKFIVTIKVLATIIYSMFFEVHDTIFDGYKQVNNDPDLYRRYERLFNAVNVMGPLSILLFLPVVIITIITLIKFLKDKSDKALLVLTILIALMNIITTFLGIMSVGLLR